ncbi:uncharacterized protein MEPE_04402 [Melanopsichium pennsylvanicum]|uniref:G-patch domain-containing protein n=2 Tax=Melanopsichium pennsylvanicum TaxID=63383 RepID=A0AAJ5C6M8_9BASI|nr:uncharacterized protein BN887_05942 [Melanopsichium pennsylvanicum 4]SNX85693.1 uncharacterized protein MEPE_04402 [Melanopsichium pennsylvanicum]
MPLDTTIFLVSQGWEGVGVPLDGKAGKGLKKPLAITQKKTLSGIGKDRDRADDWWNSIFTAGAKSLSIGPSPASSAAPTPILDKSKASCSLTSWNMGERSAATATMSLSSLAKREHARKTLMSNFVRGKPIVPAVEPSVELQKPSSAVAALKAEPEKVVAASHTQVHAALNVASCSSSILASPSSKSKKADKDAEKLQRKLAKKALRKQLEEPNTSSTSIAPAEISDLSSALAAKKCKKSKAVKKEKKSKKDAAEKASKKQKEAAGQENSMPADEARTSSLKKRKRDSTVDSSKNSPALSCVKKQKKDRVKNAKDERKGRESKVEKRDKKAAKDKLWTTDSVVIPVPGSENDKQKKQKD